MTYTLQVKAHYADNQDGSGTFRAYNNLDEMKLDLNWDDEMLEAIKNEDDPYENGEIDTESIEIEIVDGVARLAKPFILHWGQ